MQLQNAALSAQFAECLSCYNDGSRFTGNFPSNSEQRAGASFVLGVAATLPASGAVATISTGGRAIGWAVNAMNSGRAASSSVGAAAVGLSNEFLIPASPIILTPAFQQSAVEFSEGFLMEGSPPATPPGVFGSVSRKAFDETINIISG